LVASRPTCIHGQIWRNHSNKCTDRARRSQNARLFGSAKPCVPAPSTNCLFDADDSGTAFFRIYGGLLFARTGYKNRHARSNGRLIPRPIGKIIKWRSRPNSPALAAGCRTAKKGTSFALSVRASEAKSRKRPRSDWLLRRFARGLRHIGSPARLRKRVSPSICVEAQSVGALDGAVYCCRASLDGMEELRRRRVLPILADGHLLARPGDQRCAWKKYLALYSGARLSRELQNSVALATKDQSRSLVYDRMARLPRWSR